GWGRAKHLGEEGPTQTDAARAPPSYRAPEQPRGRATHVGPATDVYALGAILYELLTGRPPFRGKTTLDTLDLVRRQEPLPPGRLQPRISRDLETICLKCLEKEPHKRYPSAFALVEELRRFLAGDSIVAGPGGPAERAGRWARRHPAVAGLLLVVALVVAVGFPAVTVLWLEAAHARGEAVAKAELARQQTRQVELARD